MLRRLWATTGTRRRRGRGCRGRRSSLAARATLAFAYELYSVLSFVQMTPIQLVFLVLSTIAFGWVFALSAALGFLPLFAGEKADTLELPPPGRIGARTALLFPVYHEDPALIAGTVDAMAEELALLGRADEFDVFVLSDTRGEAAREEIAYAELKRRLAGSSTSTIAAAARTRGARPATSRTGWSGSAPTTRVSSFSTPTA